MFCSNDEKGSVLIEAAIAVPFFILLIVNVMDVSGLVLTHQAVSQIAREGIRYSGTGVTPETGTFTNTQSNCAGAGIQTCPTQGLIQARVRDLLNLAADNYGARFAPDAANSPWVITTSYGTPALGDNVRVSISLRYNGLFSLFDNSLIEVSHAGPHIGSQNVRP